MQGAQRADRDRRAFAFTAPHDGRYCFVLQKRFKDGTVSPADDQLTSFTNLATSGKQVNVLAPGVSIVSLRDPGSYVDSAYPTARVGDTRLIDNVALTLDGGT